MNEPTEIPFFVEARQIADDEHRMHTLRIEEMRMDCGYDRWDIVGYRQDYGYCDDPAEYFDRHRDSFFEEARELYAENYAECAA